MMTLKLRTKTLALIKTNEIEDIGNDLSSTARMLSDLASNPEKYSEEQFVAAYASYLREGPKTAACETVGCDRDGRLYDIDFSGEKSQNGVDSGLWTDVQQANYERDKSWL